MPPYPIKESFRWMTPEFKTVDSGKNTIKIKGVALKGNAISRNNRVYVESELEKAARSWIGKPVTINHNMNEKVGTVDWAEYEDGALEYLATIKKQPYVNLLRTKSANIRGVSIEANYLHNQCPRCGERFYTEQEFHDHMNKVHFIKTDPTSHPHGIVGKALSLVLSPEEPGITGTTVELMETWQNQPTISQLLETVINDGKERQIMTEKLRDKAVIQPIKRITADRAKQLKEQEEEPKVETPLPTPPTEDQIKSDAAAEDPQSNQNPPIHPVLPASTKDPETDQAATNTGDPTPNPKQPETKVVEQDEPEQSIQCPEGYHPNADGTECVMDEQPEAEETVDENPPEQQPVPHPVPEPHKPSNPEEDQAEEGEQSPPHIPAFTVPEPPEIKVTETTLPPKLRLGEPFSGYTDFADCVNKNQDKEDPEAYCASIKQKTEKETLIETLKPNASYARDMHISTSVNKLVDAIAELSLTTPKNLKQSIDYTERALKEISDKLAQSQKTLTLLMESKGKQQLNYILKHLKEVADKQQNTQKSVKGQFENLATEIAKRDTTKQLKETETKLTKSLQHIKESITPAEKIAELETKIAELQTTKETFEKLLAQADTNAETRDAKIKTLEEQLAEQENQKLKETEDKYTQLTTKIDNLENKLKPQFKAHETRNTETNKTSEDQPYIKDPLKGGK